MWHQPWTLSLKPYTTSASQPPFCPSPDQNASNPGPITTQFAGVTWVDETSRRMYPGNSSASVLFGASDRSNRRSLSSTAVDVRPISAALERSNGTVVVMTCNHRLTDSRLHLSLYTVGDTQMAGLRLTSLQRQHPSNAGQDGTPQKWRVAFWLPLQVRTHRQRGGHFENTKRGVFFPARALLVPSMYPTYKH